jgi:hypothetical protein
MHARGSFERYEKLFAYPKVKAPTPGGMPRTIDVMNSQRDAVIATVSLARPHHG